MPRASPQLSRGACNKEEKGPWPSLLCPCRLLPSKGTGRSSGDLGKERPPRQPLVPFSSSGHELAGMLLEYPC